MNRFLTYLNLIGVCALAVLCGIQWRANDRATRAITAAQAARATAEQQATDTGQKLATTSADLDDVRGRLAAAQGSLADAQAKLTAVTGERDQLQRQVSQDRATLDQWSAAVAKRDGVLTQQAGSLKALADQRDDAVRRFNELVGKYNSLAAATPPR
jgi:chromosome segregation ATPase